MNARILEKMRRLIILGPLLAVIVTLMGAQAVETPSLLLSHDATTSLAKSLSAARRHAQHVWRDTPPFATGTVVNAYVEIPRGERRKYEFDMAANLRKIDRVMPPDVGGYPVNYGFVPQTVSYDGDPFDALVLGPPVPGGRLARGVIVGLMLMEDEKGVDSKVVLSPIDRVGKPVHPLTDADRERIGEYFRRYKKHEPGKFSRVPGWASAEAGRRHIDVTHAFFRECREAAGSCRVAR